MFGIHITDRMRRVDVVFLSVRDSAETAATVKSAGVRLALSSPVYSRSPRAATGTRLVSADVTASASASASAGGISSLPSPPKSRSKNPSRASSPGKLHNNRNSNSNSNSDDRRSGKDKDKDKENVRATSQLSQRQEGKPKMRTIRPATGIIGSIVWLRSLNEWLRSLNEYRNTIY